jgi:hypothetical protein
MLIKLYSTKYLTNERAFSFSERAEAFKSFNKIYVLLWNIFKLNNFHLTDLFKHFCIVTNNEFHFNLMINFLFKK